MSKRMTTSTKIDWKNRIFRGGIHIPHGMICGCLMTTIPFDSSIRIASSFLYAFYFAFYEKNEDRHIKDQAWKDIVGWMPGFFGYIIVHSIIIWVRTYVHIV